METKPLLITATDGNHGYALAFAAKLLGCEAIIFMPKVKKAVLTINKLHTTYKCRSYWVLVMTLEV